MLKRLESLLRPWAIPNLTVILIAGQALLYVLKMARAGGNFGGDALAKIHLAPGMVLDGEVWRLFTFAFVPPQMAMIWAFFYWMIFYMCGTTLENEWGTVRYNLFLLIGIIANIVAAFVAWHFGALDIASNGFLYSTVFLAFARLFPNFVINIFFILPIQIKWLALLMWIGLGYGLIVGDWMQRLLIIASVFNYLVFFGRDHLRDLKQSQRRRSYQSRAEKVGKAPVHTCRICGLDSNTSPKTSFRYCSKCAGQQCYCPEHIQNHEHIVEAEEAV
ncbi:rhomboid family intramembrane serine protease [Bythopirellula goksoeyrii]|uniref:Peptidase S54 rhomboid domain-containing protein n=1 Tax=Bythopirellula goksoeyrii TaxID=1400387 RepID=A0A5B9QCE1_9BACT|nr:rhomboid family intramembrane serine protease [Bythopirellula goksoeyrii]QEG36638.1 hypothetical protein Pr1d_39530 [Bythopirellula goksoeyrii]